MMRNKDWQRRYRLPTLIAWIDFMQHLEDIGNGVYDEPSGSENDPTVPGNAPVPQVAEPEKIPGEYLYG